MRRRAVLIICGQKIVQDLVVRQLSSEFDDLAISRAVDGMSGISRAQDREFDIVLCCNKQLTKGVLDCATAKKSVLIVLRRSLREPLPEELDGEELLTLNFEEDWASQLFEKIRTLCDPKQFRKEERYHVPGMTTCLAPGPFRMVGEVVNVSLSGFLADFDYRPEYAGLLNGVDLVLSFPKHYPQPMVPGLKGRVLRVHVLEANRSIPTRVRLVVLLTETSQEQSQVLSTNMMVAARECGVDATPEEPEESPEQVA